MSEPRASQEDADLFDRRPTDDFGWLGVPPQFPVDIAMLDRAYRDRQADYHPDRFLQADPETRDEATLWASMVNDAYRRLRDSQTAAEAFYRFRFGDGGLDGAKGDSEFLIQVLEWREAIEIAQAAGDLERLNGLSDELREAISSTNQSVIEGFEANAPQKVATAIAHWKYLKKTLDDLADKIDQVIG